MLPTPSKSCAVASLPKRFMLMPDEESLQVICAAQCIGHVWSDHNSWRARTKEGRLLTTQWKSVLEAVTALFEEQNALVLLKAQ